MILQGSISVMHEAIFFAVGAVYKARIANLKKKRNQKFTDSFVPYQLQEVKKHW